MEVSTGLGIATAGLIAKPFADVAADTLKRIVGPSADEIGGLIAGPLSLLRERRKRNVEDILIRTVAKLPADEQLYAPLRIAMQAIEYGSVADDEHLRECWAGLLASACSDDGADDSNVTFTSILQQLSSLQARIIDLLCERLPKTDVGEGMVRIPENDGVNPIMVFELQNLVANCTSSRLNCDLVGLGRLGLIDIPLATAMLIKPHRVCMTEETFKPTPTCLAFYVRCKGSRLPPAEYFGFPEYHPAMY